MCKTLFIRTLITYSTVPVASASKIAENLHSGKIPRKKKKLNIKGIMISYFTMFNFFVLKATYFIVVCTVCKCSIYFLRCIFFHQSRTHSDDNTRVRGRHPELADIALHSNNGIA